MKMTLLDCSLPEKNTENIIAILKSENMNGERVPTSQEYSFNCWGFVAFYFGWEKRAKWLHREQMEDHLDECTDPIHQADVKAGDIAVFRRFGQLSHTALMTSDPSVVCHKPGQLDLCIDTLRAAEDSYGDVEFVRPCSIGV